MKKLRKRLLILAVVLIAVVGIYAVYVFATYYRLPDNMTLEVIKNGEDASFADDFAVMSGTPYLIMTYNIGFGAYQRDFSFFMDGGKYSWAKNKESVIENLSGIGDFISGVNPDFILLQEIDRSGTRAHHVDELELLDLSLKGYYYNFAQNYDSPFLFYPFWQPHGANVSGIATYSREKIGSALRRSLPISQSFSKLVDLDRCYSISRVPTDNGKELCIYNMHMSAYGSSDELRAGQLSMLYTDMAADYNKGNYVICGGDFNHNLRESNQENAPEWAYLFPRESLPEGFRMAMDEADPTDVEHNTCRDAGTPYEKDTTYTVTLDGFILSDNVMVSFYQNMDLDYEFSDHEPVIMKFILK